MASYYYLISSLPMLKSDGSVPMNFRDFLSMCEGNVSAATYESLSNIFTARSHPMLKEWSKFYGSLMDELNYQRNLKLGNPCLVPSDREADVVNNIAAALAAKNPLISEQMLLDLEFQKIDSLIGIHGFDDYYLYGYAIKLKLLERQSAFKQEEGKKEFSSLFNGVKNQILGM